MAAAALGAVSALYIACAAVVAFVLAAAGEIGSR